MSSSAANRSVARSRRARPLTVAPCELENVSVKRGSGADAAHLDRLTLWRPRMNKTRFWMATGGLALLAGVVVVIGQAQAVEKDQVKKIAEMIKKGDTAGAKKAADAYAKKNT